MSGGIDPEEGRFRPRGFGAVDPLKDLVYPFGVALPSCSNLSESAIGG